MGIHKQFPEPPAGSVWQRKGKARRVVACIGGRVCYSNGGNKLAWCGWPAWRRWAKRAEIVGQEGEPEFALEA